MIFNFEKYVGAGNDFVFLSAAPSFDTKNRSALAQSVCDRRWGIGADGCVFMEQDSAAPDRFQWDFFNSDGSSAEMCGNAARCAVLYCQNNFGVDKPIISTLCGEVAGVVTEKGSRVSWTLDDATIKPISFSLANNQLVSGIFINTGVPHFVISNNKLTSGECQEIQDHSTFSPEQTNVTLLSKDKEVFSTKTFERGVRDFTLACGTGVIASAFVLREQGVTQPYTLHAPGGILSVEINQSRVSLEGPAEKTFMGQFPWKDAP